MTASPARRRGTVIGRGLILRIDWKIAKDFALPAKSVRRPATVQP